MSAHTGAALLRLPGEERMSEQTVPSWILLFLLGIVWAIVLVPDFVRRTSANRRADSIGDFSRHLSTLQRTPRSRSAATVVPLRQAPVDTRSAASRSGAPRMTRTAAQRRRQDVLAALGAAALLTFLGAMSLGGVFMAVHVAVDVLLVAYLGLLLTVTKRERVRSVAVESSPYGADAYRADPYRPVAMSAARQRVAR